MFKWLFELKKYRDTIRSLKQERDSLLMKVDELDQIVRSVASEEIRKKYTEEQLTKIQQKEELMKLFSEILNNYRANAIVSEDPILQELLVMFGQTYYALYNKRCDWVDNAMLVFKHRGCREHIHIDKLFRFTRSLNDYVADLTEELDKSISDSLKLQADVGHKLVVLQNLIDNFVNVSTTKFDNTKPISDQLDVINSVLGVCYKQVSKHLNIHPRNIVFDEKGKIMIKGNNFETNCECVRL